MKKIFRISFFIPGALFISLAAASLGAEFDITAPLHVTRTSFTYDRPRGIGAFKPRMEAAFKKGDEEIYIYAEVDNCKVKKEDRYYHIRLAMDVDIYFEDGRCIFSEADANTFDYQLMQKETKSYIWAKLDTAFLRKGEYKIEMTIRDENSGKEAFTSAAFTII